MTTAADPTHTKEDDPSVLPTTPSVTSAVYLDTTAGNAEAELPHHDLSTVTVAVAMVTEAEDAET